MVILGLLILLVVAVIVIATLARGDDPTTIDLEWFVVRSNVTGVFIAGAVTLLIGVLGVMVLLAGLRRSRRRRTEMKTLRDRASHSDESARRSKTPETESPQASDSAPTESERGGAADSFNSAPRDR